MSQRASGYERKDHEHYPTPAWVVDALAEHVDLKGKTIWEPACGGGQMAAAIAAYGGLVIASDIVDHGFPRMAGLLDFVAPDTTNCPWLVHYDGIITNPPYGKGARLAEAFIRKALRLTADYGFVAMLLPVDFDSARTRSDIFANCPAFFGKIVLTRRIKWFEAPAGEKSAGPSQNHAWFIWSNSPVSAHLPPQILYAPRAA